MTLPQTILDALGTPVDTDDAHGEHVATQGAVRFRLRRDCHGRLRRLEVDLGDAGTARVEAATDAWVEVVPGGLAVANLAGLGKLHLQPGRLDVTFRLRPDPQRVVWLLGLCAGDAATASEPSTCRTETPTN